MRRPLDPNRFRRTPLAEPGLREGIDEELRHHVEERVDRLVEQGWDPAEARAEAERRFGNVRKIRAEVMTEAGRHQGRRWMRGGIEGWVQDVRIAMRGLRRSPGFALTLIATLALGIGATGGVFSVMDAVLFRPLPYERPDELVTVELYVEDDDYVYPQLRADQVEPWTEQADFLAAHTHYDRTSAVRTDGAEARTLQGLAVAATLPDVVGLSFAMGRGFTEEEARTEERLVVLTWSHWLEAGGDPDIVGTAVELDGERWTVIGVLDRASKYPVVGDVDFWVPLGPGFVARGRPSRQLTVIGRVQSGLGIDAAQDRADALAARLDETTPHDAGWSTVLDPVAEWRANPAFVQGLWMLGAAAAMMLLIAALNATNLLLVRGQEREGEMGVRKALGASRGRIGRHAVVESVLLAIASGVAAAAVAWASVEGIARIAPNDLTFGMVHEFGIEARTLLVIGAVSLGAGLLVGLLPALRLAGTQTAGAGAAHARGRDRASGRLRGVLVGAEVAVSVVLLVGASLFLRSFSNVSNAELGMDVDRVAIMTLSLPDSRYAEAPERAGFLDRILERAAALPGVEQVAAGVGAPPDAGGLWFRAPIGEGSAIEPPQMVVPEAQVDEGYLEALGTELRAGRSLVAGDLEAGNVVIDVDLAETVFGSADVVGRRLTMNPDDAQPDWMTIVGVVDELALGGPDENAGSGALVRGFDRDAPPSYLNVVVRTSSDPASVLPDLRRVVRSEDPALPIARLRTAEQALGEAITRPRFVVFLLGVLAAVALVLAAVGTYGVVAFSVRQRRRDLGIRVALGAPVHRVRLGVLGWGLRWAVSGTAVGLVAALLLDDRVADLLFEVQPGDAIAMVAAAGSMLAAALAACWLPALRATRVDPVEVLRAE